MPRVPVTVDGLVPAGNRVEVDGQRPAAVKVRGLARARLDRIRRRGGLFRAARAHAAVDLRNGEAWQANGRAGRRWQSNWHAGVGRWRMRHARHCNKTGVMSARGVSAVRTEAGAYRHRLVQIHRERLRENSLFGSHSAPGTPEDTEDEPVLAVIDKAG